MLSTNLLLVFFIFFRSLDIAMRKPTGAKTSNQHTLCIFVFFIFFYINGKYLNSHSNIVQNHTKKRFVDFLLNFKRRNKNHSIANNFLYRSMTKKDIINKKCIKYVDLKFWRTAGFRITIVIDLKKIETNR